MKLKTKLQLSQILVFVVIFLALTTILPTIIYLSARRSDIKSAMNLNEQIMMRVDNCFEELDRFASVVSEDEELNALLKLYVQEPSPGNLARIRLYLSELGIKDHMPSYQVLGIYINLKEDGRSYRFHTVGLSSSVISHMEKNILPDYYRQEQTDMFVEPFSFTRGESKTVFGREFSMGYGFVHAYSKNGISGSITIISSFDEIVYMVRDVGEYCKDYLLLTNNDIRVEPSVRNSAIDLNKTLQNLTYGKSYMEGYYEEPDGVSIVRMSEYGNWKLITRLTRKDILANNRSVIVLDELLVAIFGICVLLLMVPIVQRFTKPLGEVSKQMDQIARGNLDARVTVYSRDEIGEVGDSFNIMSEKLKENMNKVIEKEKIEQTMRYSLLISQVDPHFIYNTMNTITYLAQKGRNEDVIAVNKAMIEILKDRLRIEISEVYDTVEQEISVVSQYLIIQNYRYEGTFKTKIEVPEEAGAYLIAKNLLQPLVENALFHGILANKDENGEVLGGCITIKIVREDDLLVVTVRDNGAGMSEEMVDILEHQPRAQIRGAHIGLRNIRERIKYIYGEPLNIHIESMEGEGTCVTLRLPIVEEVSWRT
ncbi:sensor histidine kinase [Anaerocolumna jejuensis]|uniref:sensor histidine kinase n=1 Tax=Anaerocolumna jejuensis TaxID=259063 RepID=UPI003F7C059C